MTADAPPVTYALYPDKPLTAADTATEKSVLQGEPGHQIIWVTGVRWPTLTVYLPPKETATGAAVVICPGGGYGGEAMDLEGYDVARRFVSYGVAGIVLKYRLPTAQMSRAETPWPIQDGQQAVRMVRDRAREWGIDPHRVGIMGFSAGGHLASSVATHFDAGDPKAAGPGRAVRAVAPTSWCWDTRSSRCGPRSSTRAAGTTCWVCLPTHCWSRGTRTTNR